MSVFAFEIEEEKKKQFRAYYKAFMEEEQAEVKAYNSLDDFKQSEAYQDLSDEEKEELNQYEGKKVIILKFDSLDDAKDFVEKAQEKGLISEEKAEAMLAKIEERSQSLGNRM